MAKDALTAWKAAAKLLERRWDRASYEAWLRPTTYLRRENDTFVVGVPDSYVFDMLSHRLHSDVKEALREATGRAVEVEFRVRQAPVAPIDGETEMPLFKLMAQRASAPPGLRAPIERANGAEPPESAINPRMVFERFIVNDSNQLATEAARAVAERPASVYNPFLVYGGVGIGKTHLLHAIANSCQERGLRVLYVSSEAFTNDLVHAIRNRTSPMFREKYRSVDVLLVDDIQFIRGKDTTQEEFFHTFNTLVNFNRQIVLASDRHPRELTTLEDRLRSRFQGGLVADIAPPELETRIAIMELWARERDIQIPSKVLHVIAERSSSCIRELNGLFNQIAARLRINGGGNLSVRRAEATLNRYEKPAEQITVSHIIDVIAASFNLESDALKGKKRVARINHARQVAMYLAREMTESSLPQIGDVFGRSHTTVLHGCNKIEAEMKLDELLASRVKHLRKQIARV
ncbi:MAG: chromosomal replication initiator protein DnaA [Chloroflexota bacterium]|nr:chromosomal replication initiator protein DnaA [Chloroflexota bacterium]